MRQCIRQSKLSKAKAEEANIEPVLKKVTIILYMDQSCQALFGCFFLQNKITFLFFSQTFLKLTTRSFTISTMQLTVSNNGTQWTLDFGPDSKALSVKDLDENFTISAVEIPPGLCCCPKQKVLGQSFASSSHNSQPTRNI